MASSCSGDLASSVIRLYTTYDISFRPSLLLCLLTFLPTDKSIKLEFMSLVYNKYGFYFAYKFASIYL